MSNQGSVSKVILLRFSDIWELQILYFLMFLVIYLSALMENLLIVMAVILDHHLHNPMNFFLMNLSILDVGTISVVIPKAMVNSLLNTRTISYAACATQVFFFLVLVEADIDILIVMAYDRYTAICKPLHYEMVMNKKACVQMESSAWIAGILNSIMHTWNMFALNFCRGNVVEFFFCDIPQLLKLSFSSAYFRELCIILLSSCLALCCFTLIFASYIQIFSVVLRIPSEQGQHKAFSTCIPHLIVVSLLLFSGTFAYLKPVSHTPSGLDLIVGILYTVVPPFMNPIIYSMRNKKILATLKKMAHFQLISDIRCPLGPCKVASISFDLDLTDLRHSNSIW